MFRRKEMAELIMTVFLVIGCHAITQNDNPRHWPEFDWEGHRGSRGLMPENTIPAMTYALELGVNTLEMDAMITSDSQVILSHDPYFNPAITTLPDGSYLDSSRADSLRIYHMTFTETQRYDVGLKPYPAFPRQQKMAVTKPLLADVIDSSEAWCRTHNRALPWYNIETKTDPSTDNLNHPDPKTVVDLLMKVIHSRKVEDRVIIQSFDFRTLKYLHEKYPDIATAALVEDFDKKTLTEQLDDLGFSPDIYSPNWQLVTPQLVEDCHKEHIRVVPWTVDDPARIDTLRQWGIDGVITDYPDLIPADHS